MLRIEGYDGAEVAVFGMGRSGLAAARALAASGARPICWDDSEAGRAKAAEAGYEVSDLTDPAIVSRVAKLILSPGAPHTYPEPHPVVRAAIAEGAPVDNDIGLFFEALGSLQPRPLVIAVTGSNGKSTTSALIHHVLTSSGRPAALGGNIGRAVFDLDVGPETQAVVLELSSYQLDVARTLEPDIGVFLNLTPDHLDRHGGRGGYLAAKARLFEGARPRVAVIGCDEAEGRWLAGRLRGAPNISAAHLVCFDVVDVPMRSASIFAYCGGELTRFGPMRVGALKRPLSGFDALQGTHNHQNAASAWAALEAAGLSDAEIEQGLASFGGLAHRMQKIDERAGVAFVNDSKATNLDAAEKALSSFLRIRWIAGGVAKDGGLSGLSYAVRSVAKAYLIGECAADFAADLNALGVPYEISGDLETAVVRAAAEAQPGDTVLLSPAAASFDSYPNFEVRGDAFVTAVAQLGR